MAEAGEQGRTIYDAISLRRAIGRVYNNIVYVGMYTYYTTNLQKFSFPI